MKTIVRFYLYSSSNVCKEKADANAKEIFCDYRRKIYVLFFLLVSLDLGHVLIRRWRDTRLSFSCFLSFLFDINLSRKVFCFADK